MGRGEIEVRFRLAGAAMEWDSESEGPSGDEEEGFLLSGGSGGPFSFAGEGMLRPASSRGLVFNDALEPDRPIIYVNRGFEEGTGYRAEELLGRNWMLAGVELEWEKAA